MDNLIQHYRDLNNRLGNIYVRKCFDSLKSSHRITGIAGGRGIGKTTYLLYQLKKDFPRDNRGLYISADHIYFAENSLLSLAEKFVKQYDGRLLCIDEIHLYDGWARELKNIYDFFPTLKVIFSGSSNLDLIQEKYDLSRRATMKKLEGFSFREYLEFINGDKFPTLSLNELTKGSSKKIDSISNTPKILGHFKEYLIKGYYPFSRELLSVSDFFEALLGVIDKVIYQDISAYYYLKTPSLNVFKKILYFISTSSPGSININRLAKSLSKDHLDTAKYLDMLKNSGLLRYLLINKSGHALIRNAEKVYINNTNLAYAIGHDIGKAPEIGVIRELFVLSQLINAGHKVFFSKSGDFACEENIFEIGGKSKTGRQISNQTNAYLVKDDILHPAGRSIPIYLFGFLY